MIKCLTGLSWSWSWSRSSCRSGSRPRLRRPVLDGLLLISPSVIYLNHDDPSQCSHHQPGVPLGSVGFGCWLGSVGLKVVVVVVNEKMNLRLAGPVRSGLRCQSRWTCPLTLLLVVLLILSSSPSSSSSPPRAPGDLTDPSDRKCVLLLLLLSSTLIFNVCLSFVARGLMTWSSRARGPSLIWRSLPRAHRRRRGGARPAERGHELLWC